MSSKEFIDEDFSYELLRRAEGGCEESRRALQWLTKFNNEYHKNVIKKGDPTALHHTDELRLDCYAREYSRQNELLTVYERVDVPQESFDCVVRPSFFSRKPKK